MFKACLRIFKHSIPCLHSAHFISFSPTYQWKRKSNKLSAISITSRAFPQSAAVLCEVIKIKWRSEQKKGFLKSTAWIAVTEGKALRALMKNYSLIQLSEKWEKYEKYELEGNGI